MSIFFNFFNLTIWLPDNFYSKISLGDGKDDDDELWWTVKVMMMSIHWLSWVIDDGNDDDKNDDDDNDLDDAFDNDDDSDDDDQRKHTIDVKETSGIETGARNVAESRRKTPRPLAPVSQRRRSL